MSLKVRQIVTDRILALLDKGVAPWRCPWKSSTGERYPINPVSGTVYKGGNKFLLWGIASALGYESARWVTPRQVSKAGGKLVDAKGAGVPVVYSSPWHKVQRRKVTFEEMRKMSAADVAANICWFERYYLVFNVAHVEGCGPKIVGEPIDPATLPMAGQSPDSLAQSVADAYLADGGPSFTVRGARAFYRRSDDSVTLPELARFESSALYASAVFHELAHSTGHASRLARREIVDADGGFGSPGYAREELCAEMSAAMLCHAVGLLPCTEEDSASYCANWAARLRADDKASLFLRAASDAEKAAARIARKSCVAALFDSAALREGEAAEAA